MATVVSLSYGELVMPTKDALQLLEILERAEAYMMKYHTEEEGGNTHHIYPNESTYPARMISEDLYRMAKLAGKPEKK